MTVVNAKYNIRKSLFMSFRKCPQQAVYQMAKGDSGYGELNTENEALLKGQIFHHSMEDFYNALDMTKLVDMDEELLEEYFRSLFAKTTHPDLVSWFNWYASNEARRYKEMKKLKALEYFRPFKEEYYVSAVINGVNRTGHIDRIDKIGPKELVICEYKTGWSYDPSKSYKLTNLNAELEWYRSVMAEMDEFKDYKIVGWRLFNPTVKVDFFKEFKPVTKYAVNRATENMVKTLNKEIPTVKKIGFTCEWCAFSKECLGFKDEGHAIFGLLSKEIKGKEEKNENEK